METSLTCREVVEFLAEFLSGELPAGVRARFESHLARCPSCVAYALTYQQAIRLGRAALLCPDESSPTEAPEELVQAILEARESAL